MISLEVAEIKIHVGVDPAGGSFTLVRSKWKLHGRIPSLVFDELMVAV